MRRRETSHPNAASSIFGETQEPVRRRFGLLPPTCQEVLLVAAGIGTEFAVGTVSRVCKRDVDQARSALDGEAPDLVSAVPGVDGIYRFTDPRIRDALYEEIPAARRPWLRRQIAAHLEGS